MADHPVPGGATTERASRPADRWRVVARLIQGDPARAAKAPFAAVVAFGLFAVIILASQIPSLIDAFNRPAVNGYGGVDYLLYTDATQRWLGGGSFYQPYQLAGLYTITAGDILYPPVALWLFVPFTVLPAVIWWLVPLGMTAWVIWRLRPGPLAWPLMALCIAWPPTQVKLITGNPVMWSLMALALGCLFRWPSVFVLIKPSLAPFALFGINRRSWWLAFGLFVLLSLPFGAMWSDWLRTVANSRGGGIAYSIQEIPVLLLPLIAWRWRRRPDRSAT